MLTKLRIAAMEEMGCVGDVNAFMEGFEKVATQIPLTLLQKFQGSLAENSGKAIVGLSAGLIGAALVHGISRGSSSVENRGLRNKFEMALAQCASSNKIIHGAQPGKARAYAESLYRVAPHIMGDPNLLSSVLANAVLGEGIDPMTIKNLVELEGKYLDNNKTNPLAGIKVS